MKQTKRTDKKKPGSAGLHDYAALIVKAALAEDIGSGDITTAAIVQPGMRGQCVITAKEDMTVAGLFIAEMAFRHLDKDVVFKPFGKDGEHVKKGHTIATVAGRLGALLTAERVALNFLQRLSGIATLTRRFAAKAAPHGARILDTRKTTPCLRMFERYAVRAGGGSNHRFGLFDAVLIKDNHIKAAGGVQKAISRVNDRYQKRMPVEVEVTSLKETKEAVRAGADIIMLDNMGIADIKKAIKLINGLALIEASGGINIDNVEAVARTGVDFISVGALTHSARAADISMEVTRYAPERKR
ncbi:MAG: carboxylating nicotinate-nucleotide diphosphorylase [Deltaproteobacteria bacterium]|nr:carboxylating nicotinate-nucleotide diphosphorylase [Deltaproteobacteria bacterium]